MSPPARQKSATSFVGERDTGILRILHIVEAFGGGVYEVVRQLAERHSAAGHIVAIAYGIRPETPRDVRSAIAPDVEVIPIPWTERSLTAQVAAFRALRRLIPSWQPAVVHLHSSFATVLGAVALPREVPTVCSPHAYSFTMASQSRVRRLAFRSLEAFATRRADMVGAVSESEAATARTIGARTVRVVANGIPELDGAHQNAPYEPPAPSVLAMGRAEPQRRPADCAAILSSVSDVAKVEWVGGQSTTEEGVNVLRSAGIPVTGWLPRDEALKRLGAARAYLHWTAWDGQPLSILEAMARDVVVIASDIPPNREVLGEEQVFGTVEEAALHLRLALTDRAYAEAAIRRQRSRRSRFSSTRMAQEWLAVYRDLTREPS